MKRIQFDFGHAGIHGILLGVIALVTVVCLPARANEGMWLFNDVPEERLARDMGFVPSREWLDHLQSAAVPRADQSSCCCK